MNARLKSNLRELLFSRQEPHLQIDFCKRDADANARLALEAYSPSFSKNKQIDSIPR